ncbi:hypothetical protein TNCV_2274041 [Trichonephila clavipes]|nr:hypothetical protein TNCV_2274041 [Trichonephila clavipes]
MARSKVYEWLGRFKEDQESIECSECIRLPTTSRNVENVALVSECAQKDRRQALAQMAEATTLLKDVV